MCTAWLAEDWETLWASAAFEKLPRDTTSQNISTLRRCMTDPCIRNADRMCCPILRLRIDSLSARPHIRQVPNADKGVRSHRFPRRCQGAEFGSAMFPETDCIAG